jgi:hypothetical protein
MPDQIPRLVEAGVWFMYAMGALLALGGLAALVVLGFIIRHFWKMRENRGAFEGKIKSRLLANRDRPPTRRFKP